MRTFLIIFCVFLITNLLFFGCKKKKITYFIEGQVTNTSALGGLANLPLKIELKKAGSTFYTLLTTVNTDSQGNYNFSFENDLYEKIRITSSSSSFFPIERIIPYGDINQESNVYNLSTSAKAWARLIFTNINPSNADHLRYLKQLGKEGCTECCSSLEQNLYGPVNDTIICINDGNSIYSYSYIVLGTTNSGIKEVFTPSFDTTTLILTY